MIHGSSDRLRGWRTRAWIAEEYFFKPQRRREQRAADRKARLPYNREQENARRRRQAERLA